MATAGEQLDAIMRDLDATGAAWKAAGYVYGGPGVAGAGGRVHPPAGVERGAHRGHQRAPVVTLERAAGLGATAYLTVEADGTTRAVCSCGDLDETGHPDSGGEVRVFQRLTAHGKLHATAAARGVPWSEVRKQRARLEHRLP